jgi:hypothetical protein
MDTASCLQRLIGKRGVCKIAGGSEGIGFITLAVKVPPRFVTDDDATIIDGGQFLVRFDGLVDGSDTGEISGYDICSFGEE